MEAGAARDVIHTCDCTSCSAETEWLGEGLQKAQGSGDKVIEGEEEGEKEKEMK